MSATAFAADAAPHRADAGATALDLAIADVAPNAAPLGAPLGAPIAAPTGAPGALGPDVASADPSAIERRADAAFGLEEAILARRALRAAPRPAPEALLETELSLEDAAAIAEGRREIALGDDAWARIRAAHARLARCVSEDRLVYGVTTGFGPLADRRVPSSDIDALQRGLVYHLATGVGAPLSWAQARACAAARLVSIARGWSGASERTVDLLVALLNSPIAPWIPEKGTVGASGDLTPLAHLTLALMGEGGFIDRSGAKISNAAAFEALGRAPLDLTDRDGLALVNGVSAMTGIAVLTGAVARRLLDWSVALTAAQAELLSGRVEAWRPEFDQARPHSGQRAIGAALRARLEGSARVEARPAALDQVDAVDGRLKRAPQDAYTLRCAPQLLGAARDALAWHDAVVWRELNAASDNPIFPETQGADDAPALHGGNFMGAHVAFAADALKAALISAAGFAERQVARLTDETRSEGLPAFLHRGPAGLNSGFMGAQVTATALVSEMRAQATPASAQSIPTNGDNQDVVSLGTIAARSCARVADDHAAILAIQALAVAQGVEIALEADPGRRFAPATEAMVAQIRKISPPLLQDRPLASDIEATTALLRRAEPAID